MSDPTMVGLAVAISASFAARVRGAARRERAIAALATSPQVIAKVLAARSDEADERAGILSRVDRQRLVIGGCVIVGAALGAALASPVGSVVGGAGCAGAWAASRKRRVKRRADLLEMQLADAVTAIAVAMRAGQSVSQAIGYAAEETDPPLGETLRRVSEQLALGVSLDAALERWAERIGTDDARLVTGVLALHRRTGGDLPRVLDRVAETLSERRETAREVRGLTAQARLSGAILGFLPIGFFLFLVVTSRRDISAAFHSGVGIAAIGLGFAMQGSAFVWIRRLLRVA